MGQEWTGDLATIGITEHAADELGDIALVLPPDVGRVGEGAGEQFGEIESLKAVSDLFTPPSQRHGGRRQQGTWPGPPERVNDSPYGDGWIVRSCAMSDPAELDTLLVADAYETLIQEG